MPPQLSLFLFPCSLRPCLSPHVWYVKVLFPCPGATYTQGKHRAVCVDDCQQWPFIICQASVLWGGKYTLWIMVVLVCRRNPAWQPAEGRDKIVYEEIVYHSHGKHCPSHMRRATDPGIWCRGNLDWTHLGAEVEAWKMLFGVMIMFRLCLLYLVSNYNVIIASSLRRSYLSVM